MKTTALYAQNSCLAAFPVAAASAQRQHPDSVCAGKKRYHEGGLATSKKADNTITTATYHTRTVNR